MRTTGKHTIVTLIIMIGIIGNTVFSKLAYAADKQVRVAGSSFTDCSDVCPEMVVVPQGSFLMGDIQGGGDNDTKPVHLVTIPKAFAVGKYEITKSQFAAFAQEENYSPDKDSCYTYEVDVKTKKWEHKSRNNRGWKNPGYHQKDNYPAACISWHDAKSYIKWLNKKTGKTYRLLSEAEWEYVARAGSTTKYSFGNDDAQLCLYANGADQSTDLGWGNKKCNDGYGRKASPVGSFKVNGFGLYDLHGNVFEWVEDCLNDSYKEAGSSSKARLTGDCSYHMLRSGSWSGAPRGLRSSIRRSNKLSIRISNIGFRLARDLF